MEKIIQVYIQDINDLYEKYNQSRASLELIDYIVKEATRLKRNDSIKIMINSKIKIPHSYDKILKDSLLVQYNYSLKKHNYIDKMQVIYILIGIIILFFTSLIGSEILKEFVLIGGWVFIWGAIEVELSSEIIERRKRKVLKKLLDCEIISKM